MVSAAKWPANPAGTFWPVGEKRGAKDFASDIEEDIPAGFAILPEVPARVVAFKLPVSAQLFRVYQAGYFKIWIH